MTRPRVVHTLADVVAKPDLIDEVPAVRLPALVTEVAALVLRLGARMAQVPAPAAIPAADDLERMLTARQVAKRLRLSYGKVCSMARAGTIPASRVAGNSTIRFLAKDVRRFIRSRRVVPDAVNSSCSVDPV